MQKWDASNRTSGQGWMSYAGRKYWHKYGASIRGDGASSLSRPQHRYWPWHQATQISDVANYSSHPEPEETDEFGRWGSGDGGKCHWWCITIVGWQRGGRGDISKEGRGGGRKRDSAVKQLPWTWEDCSHSITSCDNANWVWSRSTLNKLECPDWYEMVWDMLWVLGLVLF